MKNIEIGKPLPEFSLPHAKVFAAVVDGWRCLVKMYEAKDDTHRWGREITLLEKLPPHTNIVKSLSIPPISLNLVSDLFSTGKQKNEYKYSFLSMIRT